VCLWPWVSSMQRACAILASAACPGVQYFSTLSHKRHDFGGKVTEHKMCAFIFCANLSEIFYILRRIERDIIINLLTPKDYYSSRTAPLTSKVAFYVFIQQIHVLNILNMVYTIRFFLFKMQFVS